MISTTYKRSSEMRVVPPHRLLTQLRNQSKKAMIYTALWALGQSEEWSGGPGDWTPITQL